MLDGLSTVLEHPRAPKLVENFAHKLSFVVASQTITREKLELVAMLPPPTAAASCDSLADARSVSACKHMNRLGKRERHMERMARCHWQAQPTVFNDQPQVLPANRSAGAQIWRVGTVAREQWDPLNYGAVNHFPKGKTAINARGSIDFETCKVVEEDSTWLFFRIGPFETNGGYTWSRILATIEEPSLVGQLVGGDTSRVYIGDHIMGFAHRNGSLHAYPPMHNHHTHFVQNGEMWRQRLNAHGDSECMAGQTVWCLLREYPPGLAFPTWQPLGIWSDFNDVRPPNAPPLTSYVLAGVKVLQPHGFGAPPPRPIRQSYMLLHPFLGSVYGTDDSGLSRGADGMFSTFVVNSTVETVMWSTGVLPDVDYVLDSYFHTHREMVDDVWFFQADDLSYLGLADAPWHRAFLAYIQEPCLGSPPLTADPKTPNASAAERTAACARASARAAAGGASDGGVISRLKRHLNERVAASNGRITPICKYSEHQRPFGEPDVRAAGGQVWCPFVRPISGNTRWVGIVFFRAQQPSLPVDYRMHCTVRVYHTTTSDLDDDDPRWRDMRHCDFRTDHWRRRSLADASNRQADRNCGEEIYFPFDAHLFLSLPLHPHLLLALLSIASGHNVERLLRVQGGPPAQALLDAVPLSKLEAALAVVLLVLVLACSCCCHRRSRRRKQMRTSPRVEGGLSPKGSEGCAEREGFLVQADGG